MSPEDEILILFAGTNGFSDQISLDRMRTWETDVLRFMQASHPEIGKSISVDRQITKDTEANLREALKEFNAGWSA
jgi:F-type H+-transporting ATPase subunit alpha